MFFGREFRRISLSASRIWWNFHEFRKFCGTWDICGNVVPDCAVALQLKSQLVTICFCGCHSDTNMMCLRHENFFQQTSQCCLTDMKMPSNRHHNAAQKTRQCHPTDMTNVVSKTWKLSFDLSQLAWSQANFWKWHKITSSICGATCFCCPLVVGTDIYLRTKGTSSRMSTCLPTEYIPSISKGMSGWACS